MSFLTAAALGIGLGTQALSGISSLGQSKRFDRKRQEYDRMLSDLENNRQSIINPYGNITNPFNNLGVATGASEFQAEEADISLANTLDTLTSSGYSAGGATALAQAALRSKQGISNRIEEQEMRNMELRASGQQTMEQLQGQGRQFAFMAQENRENQMLNRYAGLSQQYMGLSAQAKQNALSSFSSMGANLMSLGAGYSAGQNTEFK